MDVDASTAVIDAALAHVGAPETVRIELDIDRAPVDEIILNQSVHALLEQGFDGANLPALL